MLFICYALLLFYTTQVGYAARVPPEDFTPDELVDIDRHIEKSKDAYRDLRRDLCPNCMALCKSMDRRERPDYVKNLKRYLKNARQNVDEAARIEFIKGEFV